MRLPRANEYFRAGGNVCTLLARPNANPAPVSALRSTDHPLSAPTPGPPAVELLGDQNRLKGLAMLTPRRTLASFVALCAVSTLLGAAAPAQAYRPVSAAGPSSRDVMLV